MMRLQVIPIVAISGKVSSPKFFTKKISPRLFTKKVKKPTEVQKVLKNRWLMMFNLNKLFRIKDIFNRAHPLDEEVFLLIPNKLLKMDKNPSLLKLNIFLESYSHKYHPITTM